jgi:hypothetical protein
MVSESNGYGVIICYQGLQFVLEPDAAQIGQACVALDLFEYLHGVCVCVTAVQQ